MKKISVVKVACVAVCAALSFNASAIQVAGTLLVDLAATNVMSVGVGNKVQSWPNMGTQGEAFTNVVAGQGPELRTYGAANIPAVYFAGNANSILTGMTPDPAITGANSWTLETWINIPVLNLNNTAYFSWTFRGASSDGKGGPNYRLFEARYSRDAGNAIEHHSENVSWNNAIPPADQWHHIVKTRDANTKIEYVYVNGVQVQAQERPSVNIMPDGIFTIGGTQNSTRNGWDMLMTGYIARIRVHTGFMPLADAIKNFGEECALYGSDTKLAVWGQAGPAPLPWETPANWLGGFLPAADIRGVVNNGGSALLSTPAGRIRALALTEGTLTLEGAAALEMWVSAPGAPFYVANANNATGTLNVTEGLLGLRDTGVSGQLFAGNNNGSLGTVNVGGGVLPARLEVARDSLIGNNLGGTGRLNVLPNGLVTKWSTSTTSGYLYVGSSRADGKVTVNGGAVHYPRLTLVNNGGKGVLELNSGEVILTDMLYFSGGNTDTHPGSEAIAHLNGGLLQAPRFNIDKPQWLNAVYFNGTVVRNVNNQGDFIGNTTNLYIQAGGAIFDVVAGPKRHDVTDITIQRVLKTDPALGPAKDGGLVKRGPGVLRLSTGPHTFTGDIILEDGLLIFGRDDLMPGYAGKIVFTNPNATVGCTFKGGVPWLLSIIPTGAVGYLAIFQENAEDDIDLSQHPGIKLATRGEFTYTGNLKTASDTLTLGPLHGSTLTFSRTISGATNLVVEGQGNGTLVLAAANDYTGGTIVRGGKIRLDNLSQLGSGNIKLENDGALFLNAANFNPTTALLARIDTSSRGHILLRDTTAGLSFDLTAHPGIHIGTPDNDRTYNGTITPNANTYRIGGGWQDFRSQNGRPGLNVQNFTDNGGTPRGVAVEGAGVARIMNACTFSGPVAVTNKGGMWLSNNANQLANASDLYISDGTLRLADSVTIPSRVTLTVGSGGLDINPWSSTYANFAGDLQGDGRIWTSDAGGVFFGDAKAFTGVFDPCLANSTLGVGLGMTFGWNPATVITNSGAGAGFFGVQYDGNLLWSAAIGRPLGSDSLNLGLKKRGSGTLEVDVPHTYYHDTLIEQGTLKVGHDDALPRGYGRGRVGVSDGATLDVNGRDLTVNGLISPGLVTDSAGTAQYIRAGANDSDWVFSATLDPALTLVKTGAGTMTINDVAARVENLLAEAGTVALTLPVGISGDTVLTGNALIQVNGVTPATIEEQEGLSAYYYQMTSSGTPNNAMIATAAALNTLFYTTVPTLVTNTTHAGEALDFGWAAAAGQSANFPAPFDVYAADHFLAIYRGTFIAEETGTYTFGLLSDDRAIMHINGQIAVNHHTSSQGQTAAPITGTIFLDAGEHEMLIGFFENSGGHGLKVSLQTPSDSALGPFPQSLLKSTFGPLGASRIGGLDGPAAARLTLNGSSLTDIGPAAQGAAATFSGVVTATATSTLRKTGLGRQVIASAALSLGYIDPREGILEIATPGNATAFVASYLVNANPDSNYTGATLSSLTGGAPGGVLQLNSDGLLKMNRATTDTTFGGSIAGPADTAIVKNDNQVLTLTGNNDTFLGAWIIHNGVLNVTDGGTLGQGMILNNGELWFTRDEDYSVALSGGKGNVVKRGDGTLYVSSASGNSIAQSFVAEGGKIVFDTQGRTLLLSGSLDMAGGTFEVTGGGRVVIARGGGPFANQITIDGTEWFVQAVSISPVQDGLVIALDASNFSTLEMDADSRVSQWLSTAGAIAYTNPDTVSSPFYRASAFGGKGGVAFGTNLLTGASAPTRLSSTGSALVRNIYFVARLAGPQVSYAGIFGQSNADKGIRFESGGTSTRLRLPGSADDFANGTGGRVFLNGVNVTSVSNPEVGTIPFVASQFAGNNAAWNSAINTTVGDYWWTRDPPRNYWGEVGELLVYNRTLSEGERVEVEEYLMDKWLSGVVTSGDLPEEMIVELSHGGIMNLNNTSQTISTVIGGPGGGSVVNGTLTITDALIITLDENGNTLTPLSFDNVVFGPNAKLIVNGMEYAKGAIDLFTASSVSPLPPFANENLPQGSWRTSFRNGVCRLSHGSTLIILK